MDPRAAHTQSLLRSAVLELAAERPISEITVIDIITAAGVNRSSFYQHFDSREELLAAALERIETEMAHADEPVIVTNDSQPPAELVRFMRHFAAHRSLYRGVFGPQGSALVASQVRARMISFVRAGMELTPARPALAGLPIRIAAAGTSGALLGIIEAWLAEDQAPGPEVAAEWAWRVLRPGD